jgi:hypothetical protein
MQSTCSSSLPPPFQEQVPVAPPYNATNFNSENGPVYSTLRGYAFNLPNYPLPQDSNQDMVQRNRANIAYFVNMNNQTQSIRTLNTTTPAKVQYPQFKSDQERMMYVQGMAMTAARNAFTGQNPSGPAGVPCKTIYEIINATVPPPT